MRATWTFDSPTDMMDDLEIVNHISIVDINDINPECTLLEEIRCVNKAKEFEKQHHSSLSQYFLQKMEKFKLEIVKSRNFSYIRVNFRFSNS